MTTRGVIGDIRFLDATAAAGDPVRYRLERVGFAEDAIYMPSDVDTVVQSDGTVERRELWASAEGGRNLLCILPNGHTWRFSLEPGDTDITLQELHALNAPLEPEVSPTIQSLTTGLITTERARYASTDAGLGPDLIGYQASGADAVARTVGNKLDEIASVFDGIPVEEHAAIRAGTSTYDATVDLNSAVREGRVNEVPAGRYNLGTTLGTGFDHYTLLYEDMSNFAVRGQPGNTIIAGTGSNIRSIIFRRCSNFEVTGLNLENQGSATAGLCFENCDNGHIHHNRVAGYGRYGIVGSENTGVYQYQSSTISFDAATQQIRGVAGAFTGVTAGVRLYLANSAYNNGFGTVLSVAVDGSSVTLHVVEDDDIVLVDEAAGTSTDTLTSDTFSMIGTTLAVENGLLYFLGDNDTFVMVGSILNDGTYTVLDVAPDGLTLTVDRPFVNEAAGASITITKVGRPFVQVVDFASMDNMTIEDNDLEDCEHFGVEWFVKKKSRNLKVLNNRATRCGRGITAGAGIKAGTNYDKAEIAGNFVSYCQMGIIFSNFEDTVGHHNNISNTYKWPIAITASSHVKAPATRFGSLAVHDNWIGFTLDPSTGERFVPPVPHMPWCNFNGLTEDIDYLGIYDNTVVKQGADATGYGTGGLQFNKCYVPCKNIDVYGNTIIDSGGMAMAPLLRFTVTTESGSPWLTAVANNNTGASSPTAGWPIGAQPVGAGIPEAARIIEIDVALSRMKMNVNATASATLVPIRSGIPLGMEVYDNHWKNTGPSSTNIIQFYSNNGRWTNNEVEGFGQYPVQLLCQQGYDLWVRGGDVIRPNQSLPEVTNRGPYFTGLAVAFYSGPTLVGSGTAKDVLGAYHFDDTHLDLGSDGHADYLVNSISAGTLYMHHNTASKEGVYAVVSGGVQPTPYPFIEFGLRVSDGTAAPTSGPRLQGERIINSAPTAAKNIGMWHNRSGGTPGDWGVPGWGRGTTAQRPALGIGDKEYRYKDTTIKRDLDWDGTAYGISEYVRTMFRGTADKVVGGSAAELSLIPTGSGLIFIPASYWIAGASLRLLASGIIASTGTPTLRLRFKWAATAIVDTGALTLPALTGTRMWRLECVLTCRSTGASGTVEGAMTMLLTNAAGVVQPYVLDAIPALATVDTTANVSLGLTAQWGTSSASNTMTTNVMLAEDMY